MATGWSHPKWGAFKYDRMFWTKPVDAPSLAALSGAKAKKSGQVELRFFTDRDGDLPMAEQVALAEAVIANQTQIAKLAPEALWDDFNGRGPRSGMWWRGSPTQVGGSQWLEAYSPRPGNAADVARQLELNHLTVRQGGGWKHPLAELSFSAAFEDEHGVGILTDGKSIVGIGYSVDVRPFKK
jgi:hypothetical protein